MDRNNKKQVRSFVKKVIATSRAGLELYCAIKKKDPVYLSMGLMSAYEALDAILTKEWDSPWDFLESKGVTQVTSGLERLIFDTMKEFDFKGFTVFSKDNGKARVDSYDVVGSKAYFVVENGRPVDLYAVDQNYFLSRFGELIKESFGSCCRLCSYRENWATYFKLIPTDCCDETYVSIEDTEAYCVNVEKFKKLGLNRSTILYGLPGCGKTTFAKKVTALSNGKLLVLDSLTLRMLTDSGRIVLLNKIIDLLNPTTILLDDIEKMGEECLGLFLGCMEDMNKYKSGKIIIMATVNDLSKIPVALRRPGRFDEIIEFKLPDDNQRLEIIKKYISHFNIWHISPHLDNLVKLTEGLTPAYIKEIVLQTTVIPFEKIPALVEKIKILAKFDKESECVKEPKSNENVVETIG